MILIGRGLDFMILRSMKIEQVNKILNQELCSCQGCASNPRAPEEEEKDDGRGRSFQLELKRKNQPKQPNEQAPIRSAPVEVDI